MDSYNLIVTIEGQPPKQLTFSQPRITIGREAGDVVVPDPMCSSSHAELVWQNGRLTYRDLGSTNGSFLLGQRIQQVELLQGSIVQIGNSTIQFAGAGPARGRTVVANTVGPGGTRNLATPMPQQAQAAMPPQGSPLQNQTIQPAKPGGKTGLVLAIVGVSLVALFVIAAAAAKFFLAGDSKSGGGGPSTGGGGSSIISPFKKSSGGGVAQGGEVTVKAVWFRGTPGVKVEGGTADISLRITPNTKDGASVGVIEEFAGGTGNQWRTATWLAAFNASQATGHSLIENEYLVRAGGHIDGPSAGMLMTSTMMALLRGKSLKPNTTMTGTINPDGSAGPVGGIVQKMEGAKASGIARFGYPMGARNHVDLRDKSTVDLNDVGARLGLEVKEIHDLYEAYEFMTGETITRPKPIEESEMELDPETSQKLRAKLTAWKARLSSEITQLKESLRKQPALGQAVNQQLAQAEKLIDEGETLEKSDLPFAALSHYVQAALMAVLVRDMMTFMEHFLRGDLQGINAQIDEATAVSGQVKAFGDELLIRSKKQTVGGQVNTVLAFMAYVGAANFSDLGEDGKANAAQVLDGLKSGKIKPTNQAVEFLIKNLMMPIAYYHLAKVMLETARDYQDLVGEEGQASKANLGKLGREAGAYGSAAGAALAYFDALVTEQLETEAGMTKAQAQSAVANKEMSYLIAKQGVAMTESLKASDTDGPRNLLRLAAGVGSYFTAAGLVNKYYALGATETKSGEVVISARKSLTAQLEQARQHAREAASRAKATAGFVPVAARLEYQMAGAMREGSDADKLEALNNYWTSAFWSELAAKLASE